MDRLSAYRIHTELKTVLYVYLHGFRLMLFASNIN